MASTDDGVLAAIRAVVAAQRSMIKYLEYVYPASENNPLLADAAAR